MILGGIKNMNNTSTTTKTVDAVKTLFHIGTTVTAEAAGLVSGVVAKTADTVNKAPSDSFIGTRRDTTVGAAYESGRATGYNAFDLSEPTPKPSTKQQVDAEVPA